MKILFRIYQWCIAVPILLVITIAICLLTALGCLINKSWFGYYLPMIWGRCFCFFSCVKVKVEGRENVDKHARYMFVANHQGAYDIFSIYGYLGHNFRWMMRKGLTNIPLVGQACQLSGHIFVDTKSAEGIRKTMEDAEKSLGKGVSIVIFPEGRRTDTGKMGVFKNGTFKLASEFDMTVVPITISGSYRVMPRSTFNVTPGTITITFHKPITPEEYRHDLRVLSAMSLQAIKSALPEEQD